MQLLSRRTYWAISAISILFLQIPLTPANAAVVDFEELPVPAGGFFNGDINASSPYRDNFTILGTGDNFGAVETRQLWTSGGVSFSNNYTEAFMAWSGWSWSNVADSTTPGFGNQYASAPGGGSDGSGGTIAGQTYAMASGGGAYFNLAANTRIESLDFTNATYAYLSMLEGDQFAKQFGGVSGDDPDFFRVTFEGFAEEGGMGTSLGTVTETLADYIFEDNSQDFILRDWQTVDLSSLNDASSIAISFSSSDVGTFGINTPTYLAIDNLRFSAVPEPSSGFLMALFAIASWRRRSRRAE